MLKIACKRFFSSFHIHIFVILQMSIVFSICILMVSSVFTRFEYYLPLKDLMNCNASAVQFRDTYKIPGKINSFSQIVFRDVDPLSNLFPDKAHTWYVQYSPQLVPVEKNNQQELKFISYTENTFSLYAPKMALGDWSAILSSDLTESGNIPAILYQKNMDYKIGDVLKVKRVSTYENETENLDSTLNLEVCGFLDEKAMLFGGETGKGLHNHTSFYKTAEDFFINSEDEDIQSALFVLPQELLDRLGVGTVVSQCNGIITYDDTLSQEQVVINTERIHSMTELPAENIASIKDFSLLYIMQQVYTLLPLFVCIAILTLISSICTSAVITKKNIRSYAIFRLCGATSGKCVQICLLQSVFVSLVSLLVASGILVILSKTMQLPVIINLYSVVLCIIVLALHLLLSSLLPVHMLKGNSLKMILQRERT